MNKFTDTHIIDFANRSFRDIADQDYIAARMSYRLELDQQFLWSSLQAIEKYFKAILLYNKISSKGVRHSLTEALKRVNKINDINLDLPDDVIEFITHIDRFGENRYLEISSYILPDALMQLDKTVWHIRRFCYYLRSSIKSLTGEQVDLFPYEIKKINHEFYMGNPHKYEIFGGLLERIARENKPSYEALRWKNFYFGKTKKNIIKNYISRTSSVNPTLSLHPEAFEDLNKLVFISNGTREKHKS